MRMAQTGRTKENKANFQLDRAPERSDIARLGVILRVGFGVAKNYGALSRDRWAVALIDGKSIRQLCNFCTAHLKGNPMPGSDPIHDGPVLLSMFKEAEKQGIVELEFQKAQRFLPEKGM